MSCWCRRCGSRSVGGTGGCGSLTPIVHEFVGEFGRSARQVPCPYGILGVATQPRRSDVRAADGCTLPARLPWDPEPLPSVSTGCWSPCLTSFQGRRICERLPLVAPAGLHSCSIRAAAPISGEQGRSGGAPLPCPGGPLVRALRGEPADRQAQPHRLHTAGIKPNLRHPKRPLLSAVLTGWAQRALGRGSGSPSDGT